MVFLFRVRGIGVCGAGRESVGMVLFRSVLVVWVFGMLICDLRLKLYC